MSVFDWMSDPYLRVVLVRAAACGVPIIVACSLLSVLVVLKRLEFIGQGVSHAAYGGLGLFVAAAAALGMSTLDAGAPALRFAVISVFCAVSAVAMATVSDRGTVSANTAIGIVLAASMALGAVLMQLVRSGVIGHVPGRQTASAESLLFGQVMAVGMPDVVFAWIVSAAVLGGAWWVRRPLLFWAFDEPGASAFGVPVRGMRILMMVLLSLLIVAAMKMLGIILVSALFVLPGAAALQVSRRLGSVLVAACVVGLLGFVLGLAAAIRLGLQTGPTIVLALTLVFGVVRLGRALGGRRVAGA